MKSEVIDHEDVRMIKLSGKITIGAGDVRMRELIHAAIDQGKKKILVDLGAVKAVDSSGIGELVAAYTTVAKNGGRLALVHLSPKINDILQVTQLVTVFDIYDDEASAFAAFS